jgi:hypothetical protein
MELPGGPEPVMISGSYRIGDPKQLSIDVSQWQSSPTTLLDDAKYRFGVSHLAYLVALGIE